MVRWLFSRQGVCVMVEADRVIIHDLLARVSPYLQGNEATEERLDGVWTIRTSQRLSSLCSDLPESDRFQYDEPLVIQSDTMTILVEEETVHGVVQRVIRLLRNLFRLLIAPNALFVHGGMVQIAGRGIAFVGPKRAGKTSSLLATLTQASGAFVENDSLSLQNNGRLDGLGWFRSMYIRRDVFTALEASAAEQPYPFVTPAHAREKSSLSPQDFAATFNCTLVPQAELHMLIFPSFLPREDPPTFSLLPLRPEEARVLLAENLVPVPNEHHQWLRPFFPLQPETNPLLDAIVQQIPCYRLQQSFQALAAAAREIVMMAHTQESRPLPLAYRESLIRETTHAQTAPSSELDRMSNTAG